MSDSVETLFRRALDKPSTNIVRFFLAPVLLCTVLGKPICQEGTYYDTGTNNCDPCSHICDYSEVQKTTAECETKCPGYGRTGFPHGRECPYLQYYDEVVSRCDSCEGLCLHQTPQEQDRGETCRRLCPVVIIVIILLATCVVAVATVGVVCVVRRKKCFCQRQPKPNPELLTGEGNPLKHPEDEDE